MVNPLSPRATVLAVLYSGPANGPELRARAVKLSKGLVNPGQGSMYTTLFKLMSLKLVEKSAGGGQKKPAKGGKRMSGQFRLTAKGTAEAKKVRDAVETFFKVGSKVDFVAKAARARTRKAKANGKAKTANGKAKPAKGPRSKSTGKRMKKAAPVISAGVPAMLGGPGV
jgi:DNA-binding PadR family transcriptional regulator